MKKSYIILLLVFTCLYTNAQWVPANGFSGNTINCLDTTLTSVYAGTNNGVFISNNNGITWTASNKGLPPYTPINSLAINGSDIFAGAYGVFFSNDGGVNWTERSNGLPTYNSKPTSVNALIINGTTIIAGSQGTTPGIYVSNDKGLNWTSANFNMQIISLIKVGTSIFAGTNTNRIYISNDNGASWLPSNTGIPLYSSVYSFELNGAAIFAGTDNGVYLSMDNGATWISANTGLPLNKIYALTIKGTTIFAGTYSGEIYFSNNNGTNWAAANGLPGIGSPIKSLMAKNSALLAGVQYKDPYRSTNNGSNWTASGNGLTTLVSPYVNEIVIDGNRMLAATDGVTTGANAGLFLSTDASNSWLNLSDSVLGKNFSLYALATSGTNIFVGTFYGVLFSSDGGLSWTVRNNTIGPTYSYVLFHTGTRVFVQTTNGLYFSDNNGVNWTLCNNSLNGKSVTTFARSGTTLYAGTSYEGVYSSTDNGTNWTAANAGIQNATVLSLVAKGSKVYAGTDNSGIYFSPDKGTSWTSIGSGLPANLRIQALAIDSTNLYAGTNTKGVYLSSNSGNNWVPFNTNIEYESIATFAISDSTIFAGTISNRGIRKNKLAPIVDPTNVSAITSIPEKYIISPNPFTSQTTISFNKEVKNTTIKVVDIVGKEVRSINFSGSQLIIEKGELKTGIYFIRMISEDELISNRKIIIQ